jgi:succinate dehydrogenase flavin-adding protein (antitoxin of CptAB toxin-antitoxin module)
MQFQLVQPGISVVQILQLNDRDLYDLLISYTRPEENQTRAVINPLAKMYRRDGK